MPNIFYQGCGGQIEDTQLERFEKSGLYVAEPKFDGIWAACVSNGVQTLFSRNGLVKKLDLPKLPPGTILVGELAYGQEEASKRKQELGHDVLDVFDILEWKGKSLLDEDDTVRREILEEVHASFGMSQKEYFCLAKRIRFGFSKEYENQAEGLILKQIKDRPKLPYRIGSRNPYWIKVKKVWTVDVVLMDFEISDAETLKDRRVAKNLICGVYKNGKLVHTSDVGSFPLKMKADVAQNWNKYKGKVIEVKTFKVFDSGALRHASFVRMRDDKDPKDCTFESLFPKK